MATVRALALVLGGTAALLAALAAAPRQAVRSAEARAVAFLAGEVPAWREEHPCYSCHNNGDAARALIAAGPAAETRAALADTIAWLAAPERWAGNGAGGPYVTSTAEPFDTALAVLALDGLRRRKLTAASAFDDAGVAAAIARGRRYLTDTQLDDGSWQETTRPAGQASYAQQISTAGWALLALTGSDPERK